MRVTFYCEFSAADAESATPDLGISSSTPRIQPIQIKWFFNSSSAIAGSLIITLLLYLQFTHQSKSRLHRYYPFAV